MACENCSLLLQDLLYHTTDAAGKLALELARALATLGTYSSNGTTKDAFDINLFAYAQKTVHGCDIYHRRPETETQATIKCNKKAMSNNERLQRVPEQLQMPLPWTRCYACVLEQKNFYMN